MLQHAILIVHAILTVALICIILIQRSEGGGLGMGRSDASLMTTRGTANLLTRTTAILATLFFLTSIGLAMLAGRIQGGGSIFDQAPPPAPAAPATPGTAPSGPESNTPAPPAAPSTPAAPTR